MRFRVLTAAGLFCCASLAQAANNITQVQALGQSDFLLFSKDLAAATSYKPLEPAEPLGVTGFDIGVAGFYTKLAHPQVYRAIGYNQDYLPGARLQATKGLPFGFDVGASYSKVRNISLVGAEVKYAILKGNTALPAVAVRADYTKLGGVDQLDFSTIGYDVSVSKGFAMLTPYIGAGQVRSTSTPKGIAAAAPVNLRREKFTENKIFAGLNFNFALLNVALEADKTGDATSYGLKLGLRF